ncbi:MAG: hypothetical protein GEU90_00620 [Gemmatimonas sp.]|nr:hypothetical protein [Gemmatimonas sp.]
MDCGPDPFTEAVARDLVGSFTWRRWRWLCEAVLERAELVGETPHAAIETAALTASFLAVADCGYDATRAELLRTGRRHLECDFRGYPARGRTAEHVPLEVLDLAS